LNKIASGRLAKMRTTAESPVRYELLLGEHNLCMNDYIGQTLRLEFNGEIRCCHCQRVTKKSFNQGFCFPCFKKLAQCDRCITSPELCHYDQGTCREPEWGEKHCMQPHIVYLANSSGVKVGITRKTQVPTRWMDQGAVQALPIIEVSTRQISGLVEDIFKDWLPDKTNWRKMLKHEVEPIDLVAIREQLQEEAYEQLLELAEAFPDAHMDWVEADEWDFSYPSLEWPKKAVTYNFDKEPVVEDRLIAVKGQYLIFENASLNIRKFTSYDVSIFA